jgi:hypothetical protein
VFLVCYQMLTLYTLRSRERENFGFKKTEKNTNEIMFLRHGLR